MKTLGNKIRAELQTAAELAQRRHRGVWVTVHGCAAAEAAGIPMRLTVEPRILSRPASGLSRLSETCRAGRRAQAKRAFDSLCERVGAARVRLSMGGGTWGRDQTGNLVRVAP